LPPNLPENLGEHILGILTNPDDPQHQCEDDAIIAIVESLKSARIPESYAAQQFMIFGFCPGLRGHSDGK
jgi:hypothetical protein